MLRGTADMYVGMSALHRERDDLDAATQHLLRSQELGEHVGLPQNRYRWRVAMARIREAEGDLGGALDLLDEAERVYVGDFSPNVRPVPAMRARVWSRRGGWTTRSPGRASEGCPSTDDLSYLREFEHVTLARALLARYGPSAQSAPSTRRPGSWTASSDAAEEETGRAASSRSWCCRRSPIRLRGDIAAALAPLERALALAEPEGYVRMFVDEGAPMAALLRAAAERGIAPDYVRRLLTAFGRPRTEPPATPGLDRAAERARARRAPAARNRPERPGHRPRARRVAEHRAHPHQEHLRQARCEQPPGSGTAGRGARPAVAKPPPLTRLHITHMW